MPPSLPSSKPQRRVFIETFGCQMNVLDSELVRDQLLALGYRVASRADDADVVLFNTCAVREQSEQKVLSRLGVMSRRKQERPDLVVGMLGCMAERTGEQLQRALRHLDVVVGPSELDRLPALLDDVAAGQGQVRALSGHGVRRSRTLDAAMDRLEALDHGRMVDPDEVGAQRYVRVTRGCNKMCSFCVVPFTRGPEVHREPDAIVDEVRRLAAAGVVEVTLLGQTINHYRHGDTDFARLLARVHDEVPELRRLRFLTSYPRDFTDATLEVMATRARVCPFLHVPAQSGSDRLLKKMNRGYTVEQYLDLVRRARAAVPQLAIVGDMIVGYPSETEADHAASLELLRAVSYKTVYVFKYSPRPGTVSISRDADDVPDDVKRGRNQQMLALQHEISLAHHRGLVGSTVEVLVEGTAKVDPRDRRDQHDALVQIARPVRVAGTVRLTSRTRGDHIVAFDGAAALVGSLAQVRVTRASPLSLSGELA
ncbi:MAG: tRNA (N6-isopentenyl adenosine(37)-C2)-methylthiotransferase MiaB [Deltaproteobacteria bacterium RBG_16_71_12]|nr:MAG: tRNA (N6-isopentenyl adenosine(37)-C2)-methylthiotransferase MiaB [Deltaproteobacteria bacterium RBG_16_71_12]